MRRLAWGLVVLVAFSVAADSQNTKYANLRFLFLNSQQQVSKQVRAALKSGLVRVASEMGLAGREMPLIVVVKVSDEEAATAAVNRIAVRHIEGTNAGSYYEVWISTKTTVPDITDSMARILEREFRVPLSDTEREKIVRRVSRYLLNTVSVDAYGG